MPKTNKRKSRVNFCNTSVNYSKDEVFRFAVLYGKDSVIKAIDESSYGPGKSALLKKFPQKGHYDEQTVRTLLQPFTVGTKEWLNFVEMIARSDHGPIESDIYGYFDFTPTHRAPAPASAPPQQSRRQVSPPSIPGANSTSVGVCALHQNQLLLQQQQQIELQQHQLFLLQRQLLQQKQLIQERNVTLQQQRRQISANLSMLCESENIDPNACALNEADPGQ